MTRTLTTLYTRARARWTCCDNTGDGTLSTVIIIAGFVTLAIAIVALVTQVADGYKAKIVGPWTSAHRPAEHRAPGKTKEARLSRPPFSSLSS